MTSDSSDSSSCIKRFRSVGLSVSTYHTPHFIVRLHLSHTLLETAFSKNRNWIMHRSYDRQDRRNVEGFLRIR